MRVRSVVAVLVAVTLFGCSAAKEQTPPEGVPPDAGAVEPPDAAKPTPTLAELNAEPVSSDLKRILDGLATLSSGGDLDLDGDGKPELTTTVDTSSGTRTVVSNGVNGPLVTWSFPDGTHLDAHGDTNEDGSDDFTETVERNGTTQTEIRTWDSDLDGSEDLRVTRTFTHVDSALDRELTTLVEKQVSGNWQKVSERTGLARDNIGNDGICAGMIDRPSRGGDHVTPLPGYPGIGINVNGDNGSCSLDDAARIMRSLRRIVQQELSCLEKSNTELYFKLSNALAKGGLDISCGNHCCVSDGNGGRLCSNANTTIPGDLRSLTEGDSMSLQMGQMPTDEALDENLMHELLHFSGEDHRGGADGGGGKDEVYSCGRYCNRCTHNSLGAGEDMKDCLSCSDRAHAAHCGSRQIRKDVAGSDAAVCHGGIGANASCMKWAVDEIQACDGTVLLEKAACCAECPSNDPKNDFPCDLPPPPAKQCMATDKPSGC